MKTLLKLLGGIVLAGLLGVIALIATIEFLRHRSQREVVATVSQLTPGSSFSSVVQHLGKPTQTFSNTEDIVSWVEKNGLRVEARVATNSFLHTFSHRGPPWRYILVYTDRESQGVIHADWCPM